MPESADGIPQLVTCIAGCGFRGDPLRFSLCSACWQSLEKQAISLSEDDAINHAFGRAGFDTYREARLSAAFERIHGGSPPAAPGQAALPEGTTAWRTEVRPLTQYDEYPQRGTSACTYIAGFCALLALSRGARLAGEDWAQCITLGVKAFHAAREADAANCKGAVAPTTAAPYISRIAADEKLDLLHPLAFEETVLLLAAPGELGNQDAVVTAGHCPDFQFGKPGVAAYFQQALAPDKYSAVIVVRPPETYCVLACEDGSVALRDSHRRTQLDFATLEAFLRWLEADRSVFAAAVACPLELNCIGLYKLAKKDPEADHVSPEEVTSQVPETACADKAPDSVESAEAPEVESQARPPEEEPAAPVQSPAGPDQGAASAEVLVVRLSEALRRCQEFEQENVSLRNQLAAATQQNGTVGVCTVDDNTTATEATEATAAVDSSSAAAVDAEVQASPDTAPEAASDDFILIPESTAGIEEPRSSPAPKLGVQPAEELPRPAAASEEAPKEAASSQDAAQLEDSLRRSQSDRAMQAARIAALDLEKREFESDLVFVLSRLPPLAAPKPATGSSGFRLPDQRIVPSVAGFTMPQMPSISLPGSKKKDAGSNPDRGNGTHASSAMASVATALSREKSPSEASGSVFIGSANSSDPREAWFAYLDADGDGQLTQSEVFIGLCRLLKMESNPELVRPVRQLLSACWEDWVPNAEGRVTKEAFLRPTSGLADILVANLSEHLPVTLPKEAGPSTKGRRAARSRGTEQPECAIA